MTTPNESESKPMRDGKASKIYPLRLEDIREENIDYIRTIIDMDNARQILFDLALKEFKKSGGDADNEDE